MADAPRLGPPYDPQEAARVRQTVPAIARPDAWQQLRARLPHSWAEKVLEILEQAERARVHGELGSTFVLRAGRVTGTRVRRPEEHVG